MASSGPPFEQALLIFAYVVLPLQVIGTSVSLITDISLTFLVSVLRLNIIILSESPLNDFGSRVSMPKSAILTILSFITLSKPKSSGFFVILLQLQLNTIRRTPTAIATTKTSEVTVIIETRCHFLQPRHHLVKALPRFFLAQCFPRILLLLTMSSYSFAFPAEEEKISSLPKSKKSLFSSISTPDYINSL